MSDKITIIEDNDDVRNNVKEILETNGYDVSIAENGAIGVEVIRRNQPHLVICDIMMPEMDGYEVLSQMRKNPAVADTPFVFLTAKTAKEDLSKGMELGADDYIMKPFTIEELLSRVKMRLDKRRQVLSKSEAKLKSITDNIGMPITKEISAPLKTINAISEMIMMEHFNMDKTELVEFVSLVNKAGLELKNIVSKTVNYYQIGQLENSSDLAEIKQQKLENVQEVLKAIVEKEAEEYQRENDVLVSVVEGALSISKNYFTQAIKEILSNAFIYSPKGSVVKVVAGIDDKKYVISISDEGMGMSDEQIANIHAFSSSNEGEGGIGLGLHNAKRIIELFDGTISFSGKKGIGTVVKITVPTAQ